MTTIRKANITPSYGIIEDKKQLDLILQEILKLKPKVEVTLDGSTEIAKGTLTEWFPNRHFFTVTWSKRSKAFDALTESDSETRAFLKVFLFSTQLVFKTVTVRRLDAERGSHYRIPVQIYKQQRRGALRVPVKSCSLKTTHGNYALLDLSVSGAKIKLAEPSSKIKEGTLFKNCALKLARKTVSNPAFQASVVSIQGDTIGIRFNGLTETERTQIKQFLIEGLKIYFEGDHPSS